MTVRRLGPGDEALAAEVARRFKDRQVSVSHLRGFLADARHYVFVAEVDRDVAGFLLAYHLPRMDGERAMLFLYEIQVDPRYRRRGIGSDLIALALETVRNNEWKKAFVFTNHSNPAAVAFYKSTGARIENGDDLLFVYDQF